MGRCGDVSGDGVCLEEHGASRVFPQVAEPVLHTPFCHDCGLHVSSAMKDDLLTIARAAGRAILEVYESDFAVEHKDDRSPLTEADRRANGVILEGLRRLDPGIPVISEEIKNLPYEERRHWDRCWVVDPLDGTKEFIKRNGEFTVNIALVEQGVPVAGVVYQPVTGVAYVAVDGVAEKTGPDGVPEKLGGGRHWKDLDRVKVVASRSHLSPETEAFIAEIRATGKEVDFLSAGSSLKICLVAAGEADVYPRYAPTMEWDTAAAHAVAKAAGRKVVDAATGEPLQYNKENLLNPWFRVE
jgi:3'(2'), 5'-bisphosphate nucleotidase